MLRQEVLVLSSYFVVESSHGRVVASVPEVVT